MPHSETSDDYTEDLSKKLIIWLRDSKFWTAVRWLVRRVSRYLP